MPTLDSQRLDSERLFHDHQARERADHFVRHAESLRFTDADYLDHETWIRPAFNLLGDLNGKRVLDFGCGHGMAAVTLARCGAQVTAFDLSAGYLEEARSRAAANEVRVDFIQANGEFLPFADRSFDALWGNAVLHHLDLDRAGAELRRVLVPGGTAVFCEPWAGNPLLNWARRRLPYPGKHRTADEEPLDARGVDQLRRHFPHMECRGFQLLSMVRRVLGPTRLTRVLDQWDENILRRWPRLHQWCRYVVLVMKRNAT